MMKCWHTTPSKRLSLPALAHKLGNEFHMQRRLPVINSPLLLLLLLLLIFLIPLLSLPSPTLPPPFLFICPTLCRTTVHFLMLSISSISTLSYYHLLFIPPGCLWVCRHSPEICVQFEGRSIL